MKRMLLALALVSLLFFRGVAAENPSIAKLRIRADQGLAGAQCNLGEIYAHGYGVAKDLAEAVRWYRASAVQGYGEAEFLLGIACLEGAGMPKDEVEGFAWIETAARTGGSSVVKFRDKLTKTLQPDVVTAGHRRSVELRAEIGARKLASAKAEEK